MISVFSMDTTSRFSSLALLVDNQLQWEHHFVVQNDLTASLIPAVEFCFHHLKIDLADIDVLGIGIGPGLFTGIRVGLATLKGLILDLPKPVVPVNTLFAWAYKCRPLSGSVFPLIDAKRKEVYMAAYNFSDTGIKEISAPACLPINQLKGAVGKGKEFVFAGSGAEVHEDFLCSAFKESKVLKRSSFLAAEIAEIAHQEFINQKYILDLQQLMPLYLRQPDAVLKSGPRP